VSTCDLQREHTPAAVADDDRRTADECVDQCGDVVDVLTPRTSRATRRREASTVIADAAVSVAQRIRHVRVDGSVRARSMDEHHRRSLALFLEGNSMAVDLRILDLPVGVIHPSSIHRD
jgi:hypothetical protein